MRTTTILIFTCLLAISLAVKLPSSLRAEEISTTKRSTTIDVSQDLCSPFIVYTAITGCLVTSDYIYINSTGIPNEAGNFPDSKDPNSIKSQDFEWKIPRNPKLLSSPYTNVPQGPIGVAINGVPFYWWTDMEGNDAVVNEGDSFDQCDGHPDQAGRYHYHENPVCLYPKEYSSPPFLGYMFDGFPVYGLNDEIELDSCGGIGATAEEYRYYMTTSYPYIIGCFSGQPESSNLAGQSGQQQGGQQPPQQGGQSGQGGQQQGGQPPQQGGQSGQGGQRPQPPPGAPQPPPGAPQPPPGAPQPPPRPSN